MISRHELAWLTEAGWQRVLSHSGCPPELSVWAQRSLPLVGRRHEPGVAADVLCLGAPLPPAPDGTRRRAAFAVPAEEIARIMPPLQLELAVSACADALPVAWQEPLDTLCVQLPGLRVCGSLAMQALTGMTYLRPGSDIDLLFAPADPEALAAGVRQLQACARDVPLDGELLFPSGDAVAWKEWTAAASPSSRVLAKRRDTVRLVRRDALLSAWEAVPC